MAAERKADERNAESQRRAAEERREAQETKRQDVQKDEDVRYWADKFGVTADEGRASAPRGKSF